MMILVVDVTKGIQTQTAECLVVGEILTQQLIVVLNKTDMLPADTRADKVRKCHGGVLYPSLYLTLQC